MDNIIIDEELTLVPYFPNEEVTYWWYQDKDICKQVDNIDHTYSIDDLRAMYTYLSTNGGCYYIQYKGILVGDMTLRNNTEIAIVISKEYQNRGIGSRCLKTMLEIAKEKGMTKVLANIYSFNEQSRRLFLKAGFIQTDEEWFEYLL